MEEITIRDFTPDDLPFVIDSWLRSYYGHSYFSERITKSQFFKKHSQIVKDILTRGTTKLAVKIDDPNVIVAYLSFEKPKNVVHYVYVKEAFRHFGICRHLLSKFEFFDGTTITHLTFKGRKIQLKMGYIYSPYFNQE